MMDVYPLYKSWKRGRLICNSAMHVIRAAKSW